ncbi:MAG: serine hydrolase domain-containing protein [Spirochaetia bacterium]
MKGKKKKGTQWSFLFLPIILLSGFLHFEDGPESLENTGMYTYKEQVYYHKDFNINDLLVHNNKYTLTHLTEFINVTPIYRQGKINTLEESLNPEIGKIVMKTPHFGILSLEDFIGKSSNQGFLVIHQGKIIYENYNKMQDFQYHGWMSLTKTLVGWALYTMQDEGRIDLSKNVEDYLPEYKKTAYGRSPLKSLINMGSGVLSGDQTFGQFLPYFRFQKLAFSPKLYKSFRLLPRVNPPGEKFIYASTDTMVLTMVIEKVLNQPFADFLTQRLWTNLGMEHDAAIGMFGVNMGQGQPVSGGLGFMISTLRDLGRYGMIYTPSWHMVSPSPLISDRYWSDLSSKENRPDLRYFFELVNWLGDFEEGDVGFGKGDVPTYGAHQWDMIFDDGDMLKLGINSQGLYVSSQRDLVMAFFGYSDNPPEYAHAYARAIARYISDGQLEQHTAPFINQNEREATIEKTDENREASSA